MIFQPIVVKQFIMNCVYSPFYALTYLFTTLGNMPKRDLENPVSNMVAIPSADHHDDPVPNVWTHNGSPGMPDHPSDGFITVKTKKRAKTKAGVLSNLPNFESRNYYRPLCTNSANDGASPNVIGSKCEPDQVQVITEDWSRAQVRNNGSNIPSKVIKNQTNGKNKLDHQAKPTPIRDDFPYHLVDQLIMENHIKIKNLVNKYTPIDNCDLIHCINKLNIDARSQYIIAIRDRIRTYKLLRQRHHLAQRRRRRRNQRKLRSFRRTAYCNSATATAVTVIRNRLSSMFRNGTPNTIDDQRNHMLSTTTNVHFGQDNYISPNTSNDERSDASTVLTRTNEDQSGLVNNYQNNDTDEHNNIIDEDNNTYSSHDYLPNQETNNDVLQTNPTVIERLQQIERSIENRINTVVDGINLFEHDARQPQYIYQTPETNSNIIYASTIDNGRTGSFPLTRDSSQQPIIAEPISTDIQNNNDMNIVSSPPSTNIIFEPTPVPISHHHVEIPPIIDPPEPNPVTHDDFVIIDDIRSPTTPIVITECNTNGNHHGNGGGPPSLPSNDPGNDPSDDSSTSSSDSSSDHISNESSTDQPQDELSSHATYNTKSNRPSAKILKDLFKNASSIGFPTLSLNGDSERRKQLFISFQSALAHCTLVITELNKCFLDLNHVVRSDFSNANEALYSFILSKVDRNLHNTLIQMANENTKYRLDGHRAYKHLHKLFLPSDVEDRNITLTNFMNIQMNPNEHIFQFINRYNRQHDLLQRSGIHKSTGEIIDHFLQKVIHIKIARLQMYISIAMNTRKEERKRRLKTELSLITIQHDLCRDYDLELQQLRRQNSSGFTTSPTRTSRANMVHRNQPPLSSHTHNKKNIKKSKVTCYGCNRRGHSIKECRSTPADKKQEILTRIHGNRSNTNPHQQPASSTVANVSAQANNVTNLAPVSDNQRNVIFHSEQNPNRSTRCSIANHTRRAQCNMVRRTDPRRARHPDPSGDPNGPPRNPRLCVYNQDIILDSGASDHMCNSLDFMSNLQPTSVDVQLPDGSTRPCTQMGTIQVYIESMEDSYPYIIELTNVLYVPGFTQCLWSVTSFTQHGHSVVFGDDHVHITLYCGETYQLTIKVDQPFRHQPERRIFSANATDARPKKKINLELMHRRLGHCATKTLMAASSDDIYNDVTIEHEPTGFCTGCQIGSIRTTRRGDHPVGPTTIPGSKWFLDIVKNPSEHGLRPHIHSRYYLNMVDSHSRYQILHPLHRQLTRDVIQALQLLETVYRPHDNFTLDNITTFHTDAGVQFTSAEFQRFAHSKNINVLHAAPAHQEQNGTCESAWSHVRAIAFRLLSEARLAHHFYDHALKYAWQIKNVLPLRGLTTTIHPHVNDDLRITTPYELYFGSKPNISRFHVFGCPCIFKLYRRYPTDPSEAPAHLIPQNIINRGTRGIFIGFPINQAGYQIYVPTSGHILTSGDVAFDEDFTSPLAYPSTLFHDAIPHRTPHVGRLNIGPMAHTGPPYVTNDTADPDSPWVPYTAMPPTLPIEPYTLPDDTHTDEFPTEEEDDSDEDLFGPDDDANDQHHNTEHTPNSHTQNADTSQDMISDNPPTGTHAFASLHHDDDDDDIVFVLASDDDDSYHQLNHSSNQQDAEHMIIDDPMIEDHVIHFHNNNISVSPITTVQEEQTTLAHDFPDSNPPAITYRDCNRRSASSPPLRRSKRNVKFSYDDHFVYPMYNKKLNKKVANYFAQAFTVIKRSNFSQEEFKLMTADIINSSSSTIDTNVLGAEGTDPIYFLPEPRSLSEVIKLPINIRKAWIKSFVNEFSGLISKGTVRIVSKEDLPKVSKTVPVMEVYKCKLDQDGLIEKLKCRIVFRGDLYEPNIPEDSWNPFASYLAFRIFLALCARYNMPISSADWVQAYLQCDMASHEEVYIQFPAYWSEYLKPNLAVYCGRPLRLVKALYGYTYSGKRLYESQEIFMKKQGFTQSILLGLWYKHLPNNGLFLVLIFADDQLIATTDPQELVSYKSKLEQEFEVQWHPNANWFLKARINRDQYGDITIDQNRYSKSIVQKYIPNAQYPPSENDIKRFQNPVPHNFIWRKSDCSSNVSEVKQLETQFQFRYIEVVGSLIFLGNTAIRQLFAIRKLCKFMHMPGKRHFEALSHLLNHLRCHPTHALKYYHDVTKSPLYKHLQVSLPNTQINTSLLYFTDSAFQDCEDRRSTGCYIGFMQGGVIDMISTVPNPIACSSAEAETSFASLTYMNSLPVARTYMEIVHQHPTGTYTVPILTDSTSTIAIAANQKGTSNTKHMERRQLLVRQGQQMGHIKLYFVKGKQYQIADIGTKSGIAQHEFEYKLSICETTNFPDSTIPSKMSRSANASIVSQP